jgi:hypothetical protein
MVQSKTSKETDTNRRANSPAISLLSNRIKSCCLNNGLTGSQPFIGDPRQRFVVSTERRSASGVCLGEFTQGAHQ